MDLEVFFNLGHVKKTSIQYNTIQSRFSTRFGFWCSANLAIVSQFPLATSMSVDLRCCSRRNPFHIKVYLDADGTATGDLFWDDGESIGHCFIAVLTFNDFYAQ